MMAEDGIRIDELDPELLPTLDHGLAAMKDGKTVYYLISQIADLILQVIRDGAPEALDTLEELATFASSINAAVEAHETRLDDADPILASVAGKQDSDPMLAALAALVSSNGKFLAFTGADAPALRSILGTVSQTGGNPTGALFEYGSNANGSFIRFPDGTQVCWHIGSVAKAMATAVGALYVDDSTGNGTGFTYPAAFSVAPVHVPIAKRSTGTAPLTFNSVINPTTTTGYTLMGAVVNTGTAFPGYVAIGRWF